jgi:hypothetical protein
MPRINRPDDEAPAGPPPRGPAVPAAGRQFAVNVATSLNRRGLAAEVVTCDEDLRDFMVRQIDHLSEAAETCEDLQVRALLIEMAQGWLRLVDKARSNEPDKAN